MIITHPTPPRSQGIQSHGRSVLVWPSRLTEDERVWLRQVAPFGVRILVLEPGALDIWPGEPVSTTLRVFGSGTCGPTSSDAFEDAGDHVVAVQALHRLCGLTPLPAHVLQGSAQGWSHRVGTAGGQPVAVASAQILQWPLLCGEEVLVGAVAVHPLHRRQHRGENALGAVLAAHRPRPAAALVVDGDLPAREFFAAAGWSDHGPIASALRWE